MNLFTQHTDETAPAGAADVLARVRERYGFITSLAAYVAEAPPVLDAVLALSGAFDRASLTPQEQQVVLLTASALNGCQYCRTVHAGLGRVAGLDGETLAAVIAGAATGTARTAVHAGGDGQGSRVRWRRVFDLRVRRSAPRCISGTCRASARPCPAA